MSDNAQKSPVEVWKLLEDIPMALLVTKDGERLDARPMAATAKKDEGAIYILANKGEVPTARSRPTAKSSCRSRRASALSLFMVMPTPLMIWPRSRNCGPPSTRPGGKARKIRASGC